MPKDLLERITFSKSKDQEPAKIESIDFESRECEHCDREIKQPRFQMRKFVRPCIHTRLRCKNCNYTKDPETGEFTVHPSHADRRFLDYFQQKK